MFRQNDEPTIDEIMRDPTVRALMRADRVDVVKFEAKLRGFARSIRRTPSAAAERQTDDAVDASKRLLPLVAGFGRSAGAARHCWC
ncbi:hypothetical protein [Aureimonas leprariae]|uniref:Uncharacterized protein n=1 Tax=Plantimonas leprariae TaxID=2615207 RepID=A0A7V7PLK9_9HYPH|nr:hypothetical protein [Aureimonas leprariae]KAB0677170.1 hypothetical protein F6X38_18765 [Aureimonas leprariae]